MTLKNDTENLDLRTNTSLVISYLETSINDEVIFNSFIRNLKITKVTDQKVVVEFPTKEIQSFVKINYTGQLNQAINIIFGSVLSVNLTHQIPTNITEEFEEGDNDVKKPVTSSFINEKFTIDDYVHSEFNDAVYKLAIRLPKSPGKYSPVYLQGNSGLGKTHFLHAIGNEFIKAGYSGIYVDPSRFTSRVVELSNKSPDKLDEFIENFSKYDIILFDDIQELRSRQVTQDILFRILNNHDKPGKQIFIASDKPRDQLSGFENRFITRFSAGLDVMINKPSESDLVKIVKRKIKDYNLNFEKWDEEAILFIARNHSSSIRGIEGAIKRVDFYSEDFEDIKYTLTAMQKIFKNVGLDPSEITPDRIIREIVKYYKIPKKDVIGKSRKKDVVITRYMCMYMIRELKNLSFERIGKILNRDHSTVIHGINDIEEKMKTNPSIKDTIRIINSKIGSVN